MSLIANPRSAITKIPALFCTQFKNPDTPVSSMSDIRRVHVQWGYKGDTAIWGTSNQKLGRVVVLATAPCGRFQVEVCWSRYVDLTVDNDGMHARIIFSKAGGKVPTIC